MTSETQKVWDNLLKAQDHLRTTSKENQEPFLSLVMSEYGSEFNRLFFDRMLKIHSVSAFMVKQETRDTEPIGEHYFIANGAAVYGTLPSEPDRTPLLLVDIVASSIATAPANPTDFNPLFQRVILPLQAIVTIGEV